MDFQKSVKDDFSQPKVVYMEIQTDNPNEGYPFPCYSFDKANSIVLNTAYILSSKTIDVRYILGILNSKLGKFLVKLYVTQLQERQFRMLAQYVSKFPIVRPDIKTKDKMIELVNIMLETPCKSIENQIDSLADSIYGLSATERNYLNK